MINNKGWGNKKGNMKVNVCRSGWTTDKRGWWVGSKSMGTDVVQRLKLGKMMMAG